MLWCWGADEFETNIEATRKNMRDRSWHQANSLQTLALNKPVYVILCDHLI